MFWHNSNRHQQHKHDGEVQLNNWHPCRCDVPVSCVLQQLQHFEFHHKAEVTWESVVTDLILKPQWLLEEVQYFGTSVFCFRVMCALPLCEANAHLHSFEWPAGGSYFGCKKTCFCSGSKETKPHCLHVVYKKRKVLVSDNICWYIQHSHRIANKC